MGVYFRVYNTPRLFKQSVLMRGVKNRTENILLLLNYDFWCKNLDNIISGPRRTVQNRKLRQFMTPLSGGITLGTFYYIFITYIYIVPVHFLLVIGTLRVFILDPVSVYTWSPDAFGWGWDSTVQTLMPFPKQSVNDFPSWSITDPCTSFTFELQ